MKALYHQDGVEPKEFDVLQKHADGTVDLGIEGEDAVVTRCPVSDDAVFGQCSLVKPAAAPKKDDGKGDDKDKDSSKDKKPAK